MNLDKLFKIQAELDNRIIEKKGLQGQDLLDKKILALQVELGELANEWRGFKFWSHDQESRIKDYKQIKCKWCNGSGDDGTGVCPDCRSSGDVYKEYNPLLEEYVDCLHFILSIGLEHEYDDILQVLEIIPIHLSDITEQFTMLMRTDWNIYEEGDGAYYHEGLELFLGLGEQLGFTWEQIEQAYLDKNKVNHERQNSGY